MLLYDNQGVYQKNQPGKRLDKRQDMIPGIHIISRKAGVASVNEAGVSGGCSEPLNRGLVGGPPLRKFLGSKEHLDWLKTDLNAAKIITAQDYKGTKN